MGCCYFLVDLDHTRISIDGWMQGGYLFALRQTVVQVALNNHRHLVRDYFEFNNIIYIPCQVATE